ncbi:hypothetical protein NH340_JMT00217 [Sarcoptes scabiei]|nr:hypothetical protein NH340_JMT00217 [Sarcoptes scabiei]
MDRSPSEKNAKIMPENLFSNDLSNRLNQSMSVSLRNEENLQNQDESQQRSESSTHQEINCERSTAISSTNRLFEVHERMMNNLTIVSFDPQSIQNRFNNEKYLKIKFFYLILLLVMFCYTIIMVIIMCELRNSFHQRQSISEIHTKSNEKNQSFSNFDSDSDSNSDSNHHIHSDRHHFYQNDFDLDRTKKSFLNEMILFDSINSFIYLMAMIAVLRESYVVTMATNLTMLISLVHFVCEIFFHKEIDINPSLQQNLFDAFIRSGVILMAIVFAKQLKHRREFYRSMRQKKSITSFRDDYFNNNNNNNNSSNLIASEINLNNSIDMESDRRLDSTRNGNESSFDDLPPSYNDALQCPMLSIEYLHRNRIENVSL